MFSASIWLALAGSPPVKERFWSKSLKELVSVRNVQIVTDGMTIGSFTLKSVCMLVAPSIDAASIRSPGTFCRPAM